MSFAPIAMTVRALRTDNRSPVQYALRGALVGMFILALISALGTSAFLGAPGLNLFTYVVYLNFAFLTMLAVSVFSTVITEEKQAGSLDLLKLAGFRPYSIVLGKSAGLLVATTLLILVQVPFAMLAATLGGISSHQIFAAYAVLVSYGVFLWGLALVSSVVCQDNLGAARLTAAVALGLLIVPWLGTTVLDALSSSGAIQGQEAMVVASARLIEALEARSSLIALSGILATGFDGSLLSDVVVWSLILGATMLLLSWTLFSRFTGAAGTSTLARLGGRIARRGRTRPGVRRRALVWKDFHFMAGGRTGLDVRLVVYGLVFLLVGLLSPASRLGSHLVEWGMLMMSLMVGAMFLEAGIQASRVFREEIRQNTLFGLALLPAGIHRWCVDKFWGGMGVILAPLSYFALATTMVFCAGIAAGSFDMAMIPLVAVPIGSIYVSSALAFLVYLVGYVSLFVRHGAFPITLAGILVACFVLGPMSAGMRTFGCAAFLFGPLWFIFGIAFLQRAIGSRLRKLAAQ